MLNLSPIQEDVMRNSHARLNFLIGSVRSGKTFVSLLRWLRYIQTAPEGNFVMVGRTAHTIKRNLIDEIFNIVGNQARYFIGKGELHLWGKKIYLVGCSDSRSESKLRGSTFSGAYVDEATLIPQAFWTMLLSRLSLEGAKLFATTNPDSPFHWFKTDYIDRKDELDVKIFKFNLEDNPSLSDDFKNNLKKEYRGLWYKRFIDGEWVLADGAVYDFFDESIHVIPYPQAEANYYICGIDYGTTHPCTFSLIGYNPGAYPNMWLEKEYYYDSQRTHTQKSDYDYALDFIEFIRGYNIQMTYIDPAAASLKQEFKRNGLYNIKDADNDVLPGIRFQAMLISNGTYKICSNCVESIKEYGTYLWDSKASEKGQDKPIKKHDDCCDAQRYALYSHFFSKNIEEKEFTEADAERLQRMYG